jgi:hypothetical protein
MSVEALRWAMRQKSRNAATQCVLLVLANAADPEGVAFGWWKSRDHWWPYIMERTRLSRGAVFRLMKELEDKGYFTRDQAKPKEGGPPQPVIRLHIERDVIEPERPGIVQSTAATEEPERTPSESGSQYTAETQNQSSPATENAVAVTPQRLDESTLATTERIPLGNPITPQSPPLRRRSAEEEPNGFATFWSDYPDHQAMNRSSALREFNDLTETDQQLAIKTVGFYARDIARLKRRAVSAANWLKERRFTEYSAGRQTAGGSGSLVHVAEGSEAWQAWANVAAVAYGGQPKIPYHWGAQGKPGAWRPTTWPLGAEAWLMPLGQWLFVESGTAQHGRWCERISEMLNGRMPVPVRLGQVKPARAIYAGGAAPPEGSKEPLGLFVPLEWPPPKGTAKKSPDETELKKAG